MVGRTLAHYKILEKIGSGGMGDVYLAEDTKLDRKVALKVLPQEVAGNRERRARFEREAKAVASLNHPNIVAVHSVEESGGVHFITMELVTGNSVAELIPKKGFSIDRLFEIAVPLTDAIAAAHDRGIVHRDLKPLNVMWTDDHRVKVLDFGLAKIHGGAVGLASEVPTQAKTEEGVVVGTVSYMSPEQAEGKTVDHRTDVFSLGVILHELATGERPFRGDSTASVLSSILRDSPVPVTEIKPELPAELSKIVRRCLVKDVEHRYQSAKDVRNELEELKRDMDSGSIVAPVPRRETGRSRRFIAVLAVALVRGARRVVLLASPRAEGAAAREPRADHVRHRCGGSSDMVPGRADDRL
jgi:serine/threonine protein kinase